QRHVVVVLGGQGRELALYIKEIVDEGVFERVLAQGDTILVVDRVVRRKRQAADWSAHLGALFILRIPCWLQDSCSFRACFLRYFDFKLHREEARTGKPAPVRCRNAPRVKPLAGYWR